MKILVVIPARAGSKGVPGKNSKELNGKALIEYTIDAALGVQGISPSDILVTTDCPKVMKICEKKDVTLWLRPQDLCRDETPMAPVLKDALTSRPDDLSYTHVLLLQPTCPFREVSHIEAAISVCRDSPPDATVVSVYEVEDAHPGRMYRLYRGSLQPLYPDLVERNRQDLPPVFHRNGSIYLTPSNYIRKGMIYSEKLIPFVMSADDSMNIDSQTDWKVAEALLSSRA